MGYNHVHPHKPINFNEMDSSNSNDSFNDELELNKTPPLIFSNDNDAAISDASTDSSLNGSKQLNVTQTMELHTDNVNKQGNTVNEGN